MSTRRSAVTVDAFVQLGAIEKCAALRQRPCSAEVIRVGDPGAPGDALRKGMEEVPWWVRPARPGTRARPRT